MPDAAAGNAWGITGLIAAVKIAETQTPRDGDYAPLAPRLGTDTEQPRKPTVGRVTDGPCWLIV